MNVSKNQLVCARCHFVGLASGIVWMTKSSGTSDSQRLSVKRRVVRYCSNNAWASTNRECFETWWRPVSCRGLFSRKEFLALILFLRALNLSGRDANHTRMLTPLFKSDHPTSAPGATPRSTRGDLFDLSL